MHHFILYLTLKRDDFSRLLKFFLFRLRRIQYNAYLFHAEGIPCNATQTRPDEKLPD